MNRWKMGALLGALALGACGSDDGGGDKGGDGDEKQTLRIAWVPKALDNIVFETGRDGAFLRATEINDDPASDVKIEVIYDASKNSDATEQAAVIDKLVA